VTISTNVVNVDAVVYHKKSGQIVTGLKKPNFAIFADGVQQTITNFSTPEAPITVAMVIEYSKWSEMFGYYGSGGYDPGTYEVIRPAAMFLTQFIKPPDDYVSVVAFDIRPTPLTDFTNDRARISQVINLLLRNTPAFRETNLFDALKFVLVDIRGWNFDFTLNRTRCPLRICFGPTITEKDGSVTRGWSYTGIDALDSSYDPDIHHVGGVKWTTIYLGDQPLETGSTNVDLPNADRTLYHELGHALGLEHTRDFDDIMYFFGYGGDVVEFFGRYRAHLHTRDDIATTSGLSAADLERMRMMYGRE